MVDVDMLLISLRKLNDPHEPNDSQVGMQIPAIDRGQLVTLFGFKEKTREYAESSPDKTSFQRN